MNILSSILKKLLSSWGKAEIAPENRNSSQGFCEQIPHLPPPSAPSRTVNTESPKKAGSEIIISSFPDLQNTVGPVPLTNETISIHIPKSHPGHFALGSNHENGGLILKSIGYSSNDLSAELERAIGTETHFMAHVDSDDKSAFIGACMLYHQFRDKLNITHPMKRFDQIWGCPKCGVFNPGP